MVTRIECISWINLHIMAILSMIQYLNLFATLVGIIGSVASTLSLFGVNLKPNKSESNKRFEQHLTCQFPTRPELYKLGRVLLAFEC